MEIEQDNITINRKAFNNAIEEIQLMVESLELMSDPKVMEAHKRAKEEIKNRDFANWDEL